MKDLNQLLIEAQKLTNSISFTVEVITPEIAIKYLNTSIGNRNKLIKFRIKKLLHQMTEESAVRIASKYNLQYEVLQSIKSGCTPEEALKQYCLL